IERDGGAFEAARGDRRQARRQRIDGDGLGRRGGGAEIALGIPGGGGHAEGEVGVGGRGDGQAGEVPAVHIDGGAAGAGREGVGAVAERGAERERDGGAFEAARGDRRQARRQRIDGDGLGRRGGGAEIALGIPGGGGH